MKPKKLQWKSLKVCCNIWAKKKNNLVSRNVSDKENRYSGGRKFIFLNNLIDSNGIRTHNHLFRKGTLNHLAKLASCRV